MLYKSDSRFQLVTLKLESLPGSQNGSSFSFHSGNTDSKIPGPDFWSWTPPISNDSANGSGMLKPANKSSSYPATPNPIMEKERPADALSIPFESKLSETNHNPPLPPLQSFMEVEKTEVSTSSQVTPSFEEERELGVQFLVHAAEAAHALQKVDEALPYGVNLDGSRWWKETGVEQRLDGVVCRWTLTRGVSADGAVEWEEKFWEAADEYNYKELGSEKSGRDSTGNVWREYWKESMSQVIVKLMVLINILSCRFSLYMIVYEVFTIHDYTWYACFY